MVKVSADSFASQASGGPKATASGRRVIDTGMPATSRPRKSDGLYGMILSVPARPIGTTGIPSAHARWAAPVWNLRKRVEEIFGWMKTVGGFRRTRYRGLERTQLAGYLVATAYNLVRMARLLATATAA
jgi:hypothetical protein